MPSTYRHAHPSEQERKKCRFVNCDACGVPSRLPSSSKRLFWCAFFFLCLPKDREVWVDNKTNWILQPRTLFRALFYPPSFSLPSLLFTHRPFLCLVCLSMGGIWWVDGGWLFWLFWLVHFRGHDSQQSTNNSRNQQANRHHDWDRVEGEAKWVGMLG